MAARSDHRCGEELFAYLTAEGGFYACEAGEGSWEPVSGVRNIGGGIFGGCPRHCGAREGMMRSVVIWRWDVPGWCHEELA